MPGPKLGRNDGHRVVRLGLGIERLAQVAYLGVNIETVDRADTLLESLQGIMLHLAGRRAEDSHIHPLQFVERRHHPIVRQLPGNIGYPTTYHTRNLKVGCHLQGLQYKVAYIAITYYGSSDFLHISFLFLIFEA